MMNHRENDTTQENEGKQVQQELEEQLRAFGDTMSDAFAHGFEGRGMDIGDRAFDVGKAAVHAANYGISEAGKAMRQARDSYYQSQRQAHANGGTAEQYAGMPQWARNFFASRPELTPVEKLRKCAKERYSSGVALLAVGIIFAVLFGLGTLGCLIGLGFISPAALGDVVVSTAEGGGILMTGTDYVMNTAYNVLGIISSALALATAGFGWMAACGVSQREAGRQMGQLADLADSMDGGKGLPVEMLADLTHQKKKKTLKRLKKSIRKGWLNAWLDEKTETVYLTAEDYRAAQERPEPQPAPAQPEQEAAPETPLNLETARRFAKVLEQEQQLIAMLGQENDAKARSRLIEHNLRLVVYIAKKFDNTGVELDDLISVGTIGLIKAINTFNADKNIKLATYAPRCIENEILMYLRKVSRIKGEISLDEPLNVDWEGNELLLSDVLGTDSDIVYKDMENADETRTLREAIERLSPRERQIMDLRFGLKGEEELTQKEVADVLGISQSYISRLGKKIVYKLRKEFKRLG